MCVCICTHTCFCVEHFYVKSLHCINKSMHVCVQALEVCESLCCLLVCVCVCIYGLHRLCDCVSVCGGAGPVSTFLPSYILQATYRTNTVRESVGSHSQGRHHLITNTHTHLHHNLFTTDKNPSIAINARN